MKKSEQLDLEASKLENDNEAWRVHKKASRERGEEEFNGEYYGYIEECGHLVTKQGDGHYIVYCEAWGLLDIFPKGKKLRIRKLNKWVSDYRPWVKKHLING